MNENISFFVHAYSVQKFKVQGQSQQKKNYCLKRYNGTAQAIAGCKHTHTHMNNDDNDKCSTSLSTDNKR